MKSKIVLSVGLLLVLSLAMACTKEVIKEVEVPGETIIVEQEVIKEIPGETVIVEKEVVKEVLIEKAAAVDMSVNGVSPPSYQWDGPNPSSYNEAPVLAALVAEGKLPPVEDRLPDNPLVLRVGERIGDYGGTWRNVTTCTDKGGSIEYMHDQPIAMDVDDATPMPNVVRAWESSSDFRNWTIHLRKGMKWSNGDDFGSDDWVYAVNDILRNEEINANKREGALANAGGDKGVVMHRGMGDIVKIDDNSFRYEFDDPSPNFLQDFAETSWWGYSVSAWMGGSFTTFAPSKYLKQFHASYADAAELQALVEAEGLETWVQLHSKKATIHEPGPALGAWVVVDNSPGAAVFERNPYYWAVDAAGNQLPYIDKIVHTCGENPEAINLKVLAGESDFHLRTGSHFEKYPLFQKTGARENQHTLAPTSEMFVIAAPNLDYEADAEVARLMQHKDFRVAISLSIDKQEWVDTYMFGLGKPGNISFTVTSPFYDGAEASRNLYTIQDVERANALLDGLGLDKRDAGGNRLRADNGKPLSVNLVTPADVVGPTIVEATASEISKETGFDMVADIPPIEIWTATLQENNQHIVFGGFQGGPYPVLPDRHWGPRIQQWAITNGREGQAPTDPKMLRMFEIAEEAQPLPYADREALYQEAYLIIAEEAFIIGIAAEAPFQHSFSVAKNNLINIPGGWGDEVMWVSRYQNGGAAGIRPEQWFFEGGKNDAGY